MTVGITNEYIEQVRELLNDWDHNKRFFKANQMQKLVGKLARLGEGAPWIYKLMSHLYSSLAFALKNNTKLLTQSSSKFRNLLEQISTKTFSRKIFDHQRLVNFALKKTGKMVNKNNRTYLVNSTMQEELMFLAETLKPDLGINFKTPIAHLISTQHQ